MTKPAWSVSRTGGDPRYTPAGGPSPTKTSNTFSALEENDLTQLNSQQAADAVHSSPFRTALTAEQERAAQDTHIQMVLETADHHQGNLPAEHTVGSTVYPPNRPRYTDANSDKNSEEESEYSSEPTDDRGDTIARGLNLAVTRLSEEIRGDSPFVVKSP